MDQLNDQKLIQLMDNQNILYISMFYLENFHQENVKEDYSK